VPVTDALQERLIQMGIPESAVGAIRELGVDHPLDLRFLDEAAIASLALHEDHAMCLSKERSRLEADAEM